MQSNVQLSVLHAQILDMISEGKTPRQVEQITGVPAADVHRIVDELLNKELNLDTEAKRRIQVYRLEKIVEALWERVMKHADRDDVRNLVEVLDRLNELLALHKERDAEELVRATEHQKVLYIASLKTLINAFKAIAPNAMTDEEWDAWAANQIMIAQASLEANAGQINNMKQIEK